MRTPGALTIESSRACSFVNCLNTASPEVLETIEHFFAPLWGVTCPIGNLADDAQWLHPVWRSHKRKSPVSSYHSWKRSPVRSGPRPLGPPWYVGTPCASYRSALHRHPPTYTFVLLM